MQDTQIVANGRTFDEASDDFQAAAAREVEPSRVYHDRKDIPPPPVEADSSAPRREKWLKLPTSADFGYSRWMVYMWTNFPSDLLNRIPDIPGEERKTNLNRIFLQHNGWKDYQGNPYPQPGEDVAEGEPDFWDAIPQEVANALIQLMNVQQRQLSFLVEERPRSSRRA